MGLWRQYFPYHARWMGVNNTTRKEEGTTQHNKEDYDNSCVLLDYNNSCVLLDNMGSCVLLDDCSIVLETVTDDSIYQWHGSSCVLLVDCRVVNGLLDEDIVEIYLPI
jgi:hypothetical protein